MNQILNFVLLGMFGLQEILALLFFPMLILIPSIFYLLTLQKTLNLISVENRKMQPVQVWLTLIPLFGLVWQFIIVNRLADSLKAEFEKKNFAIEEERPGLNIGMAYCILLCCSLIPFSIRLIGGIGGIICWIIYWIKINKYKIKLEQI